MRRKWNILVAVLLLTRTTLALAGEVAGQATPVAPAKVLAVPPAGTAANRGYRLYLLNCAHCHGSDARGDEGPDLYAVKKSDQRIASYIKDGIKGEMPKFGAKLSDADVQALIAFVRSLKP